MPPSILGVSSLDCYDLRSQPLSIHVVDLSDSGCFMFAWRKLIFKYDMVQKPRERRTVQNVSSTRVCSQSQSTEADQEIDYVQFFVNIIFFSDPNYMLNKLHLVFRP
jgi:hypothetical protein